MKSMLMATIKRRGDLLMRVVGIIVLLAETARFVEAMKPGIPPVLPKQYQGNGNVLQALLNASWPTAQGPTTTYTFFAPRNSAVKKYPCLFSTTNKGDLMGKSIATSVLQYHIIPGKALSSQSLKNLAATADYMSSTAYIGRKLNVTKGGTKLNGYSSITSPDIGTKQTQAIHGISTLLVPPGLIIGCGPPAPVVKGSGNSSDASLPLRLQTPTLRNVHVGIAFMSVVTSLYFTN